MVRPLVLESRPRRWLVTAALLAAAVGASHLLLSVVGERVPFLPFLLAISFVSLSAGFWPSVCVLTAAIAWTAAHMLAEGGAMHAIGWGAAGVILALGAVAGLSIAALGAWARQLLVEARGAAGRLNMALRAGRMAAWEWDVRSGSVRFAPGAHEVFGTECVDMEQAWGLAHPDDVARLRETVEAALRDKDSYTMLGRFVRPDTHELRWLETTGSIDRDGSGRASRVAGVSMDVTDRERALEDSRTTHERLRLALHAGKVTAWETDAERRYTWMYNVQLGLDDSKMVGRRMGETNRNEEFLREIDEVYATGAARQFQLAVPGEDGTLSFLCWVKPELDAAGNVVRITGASVDVTELHRAQEQLRIEAQRKDRFLATLAHELRNPMAPIRFAAAMLGDRATPAQRDKAREVIERQASHMTRLLDDLLDVSRISRNVIELRREVFDMRRAAELAVETCSAAYAQSGHQLTMSLPARPVHVEGDAARIQQVLGNLLDNARKYTPGGGNVSLRVAQDGDNAVVHVIDDGIGIDPSHHSAIFELFTRVDAPGYGMSGLGIGLAVVKQIIQLHGGRVFVRSEGAGRGTEFVIELPVATAAADPHTGAGAQVLPLFANARLVLAVDDNHDTADSLAALLRTFGYSAAVAYSGQHALQVFDELSPTIVLLDIGLPDISGVEVARRLREKNADVVLVAISGWGQEQDLQQTSAAGFDLHLVKPVDPRDLAAALDSVVSNRKAA